MVELLAITSCVCAPPSDHALNCQDFLAFVCGVGAEIEFRDPWITVLVKRRRGLRAVQHQGEPARAGVERQGDRLRVQPDGPGVGQPAGVPGREPQLEVGGVLVVGRRE